MSSLDYSFNTQYLKVKTKFNPNPLLLLWEGLPQLLVQCLHSDNLLNLDSSMDFNRLSSWNPLCTFHTFKPLIMVWACSFFANRTYAHSDICRISPDYVNLKGRGRSFHCADTRIVLSRHKTYLVGLIVAGHYGLKAHLHIKVNQLYLSFYTSFVWYTLYFEWLSCPYRLCSRSWAQFSLVGSLPKYL